MVKKNMVLRTSRKNGKVYVYDTDKKTGRYYKELPFATNLHYEALYLNNLNKKKIKTSKFLEEMILKEGEIRRKRKEEIYEKKIYTPKQIKSMESARNLIDTRKTGRININYKGDYIDDIALTKGLLKQVINEKGNIKQLMQKRQYVKDLIDIEIVFRGEDKLNKMENAVLATVNLHNTSIEDLKAMLSKHKMIGYYFDYALKLEQEDILRNIYGTNNVNVLHVKGYVANIGITARIGGK